MYLHIFAANVDGLSSLIIFTVLQESCYGGTNLSPEGYAPHTSDDLNYKNLVKLSLLTDKINLHPFYR
jgi:hypothetical protein